MPHFLERNGVVDLDLRCTFENSRGSVLAEVPRKGNMADNVDNA